MKIKLFIGGGDTINGILEAAYQMANLLRLMTEPLNFTPSSVGDIHKCRALNPVSSLVKLHVQISAIPFSKSFGNLKDQLQTCSEQRSKQLPVQVNLDPGPEFVLL